MTTTASRALARQTATAPTQRIVLPSGGMTETLVGDARGISKELARLGAAGQLLTAGARRVIPYGPQAGLIQVTITRLPEPAPPSWARRCIAIGAGLGVFAGVAGAIAWVLLSMSGAALATLCGMALLSLIALLRAGRAPSRTSGVTATAVAIASVTAR